MIAIHRGSNILLEVQVNQGSIRRFNLMKEDFIRLKFSLASNTPLLIGDYVDLTDYINSCDNENFRIKNDIADQTTKRFVIDRNYYPTFNKETGGWDYDVQINAYYHQWKNKIFMFNPSKGAAESSFSVTDTIFTHAALLVKNLDLAEFTYNDTKFTVLYQEEFEGQLKAKGMKLITYSAVSIYGALDLIAQAFECEWWLDGGLTIYFGYRKGSETLTLTLNEEIADASISDSDGVHATRIYAFGGTTNVPAHYRDKLEFKVSEIVNTSVGNTFRDISKPITSNWFRGRYSEQPTVMDFDAETIDSGAYICQKYYNAPLSGGQIEGTVKGLSLTLEPTIYGYYEDSDIWPSIDLEVALDVTNEHWIYRQDKQVLLRKCSTMSGTSIDGVYYGNFTYADGTIKSYVTNTESGNGMIGISSFPIEAGKYYAVHIEDTTYSELLDYFILFSESNVAAGISVSELWSFDKKKKYGFYYKAEKSGNLLIPQPSYTPATPIVKEVERVQYSLFESPYDFQWTYDTVNWDNILLRADIKDGVDGLHDLATSVYHNVKYRVITPNWSIETQRVDKAVDTIVVIGGEERECTINPLFAPATNGHLIKIDGYTPNIGDVFTFPNIIINRVEGSYFTQEDGGVQNGVVQKNLMLPIGTNYVQANGVADADVVEAIMVYDWIYPKTALKVTNVEPFNKWEVEIEDGQTIYTTTYDITLPIEDYEDDLWVDPSKMYAIFQSGKAAGLHFELQLVDEKLTSTDVTFRLVPNEDYSVTIPNDATIPDIDDEVILEGIDISFLSGSAITNAENELLAQANKDILETSKEDKVVDITLTPTDAYNRGRIALGTLTSLEGVLSSGGGAYDNRVLGFEECLDIPWDKPKYIIGYRNYYNRQASIESKLENIEKGSITLSGVSIGGGSNIPIIKVKDSTKPTDANVYSALRSREEFAKRKEEEIFSEKVTFNKDIDVKGSTKTKSLSVSNDANIGGNNSVGGNQTIQGTQEVGGLQTLKGGFQTPNFNNAAGQITGAHLTPDGKLFVSGLKANNFEIDELIFNVVKAQGGEYVYSTSTIIESCTYVMTDGTQYTPDEFYALDTHDWQQIDHILITLKEDEFTGYGNPFEEGDIIYGKVNQVMESGKHAVGGECIMYVTAVEDNTLNITAKLYQVGEEGVVGNIPPIEDMVIAQRGNKNGAAGRTTSFYLSTITGNLVMLYNVTTPTLSAANYGASFGKLPYDLYLEVHKVYAGITEHDPVTYSKYIVTENWIQFDHLGQPIKFEVYRGDWRYDTATSDKPYVETASTYDTVTHNGAKWRVCTSNTETEPRDGYGDWERLTDANITVYTLAPSSNIIYIRDAGVVTPSELDVTVKSTTSLGTETISDQATLVGKNLTVWYTIDGDDTRHMLVLGGAAVFETEDGTSVFATEADSESESVPLYLEGASIDLSKVSDNITLHLVENYPDNPTNKASYVIPVVNDGASPLGLELTPSALSVSVDATTLATAGVRDYESTVRIKQGVSYIDDISEYTMQLTYTLRSGEVGASNILDTDYIVDDWSEGTGWKIYVQSGNGIVKNKQIERIDISILHGEAVIATGAILFNYLERGITGPAGKDGPFLYPCGTWKEGTEYKFTYQLDSNGNIVNDSDNKPIVIAKPFVYYKSPEGAENYYVLEKNVPENSNIEVTNTEYWKPFTKIQYIFTEALMANWARLGGTNGAYFWGNYMFSTRGVDEHGNSIDIPAFAESMFTDGKLNGTITPNIFLDFYSGGAKLGKLSESYVRVDGFSPLYRMDVNECHNISSAYRNRHPLVITLPSSNTDAQRQWTEDGTHCSIAFDYWHQYTENPADDTYKEQGVIAICADDRFLNPQSSREDYGTMLESMKNDSFGWMIWKGRRVKFLLLAAGSMLSLRSLRTEDGGIIWYVMNSGEFEELDGDIKLYRDAADVSDDDYDSPVGSIYDDTEGMQGGWLGTLVGSPTLNWFKTTPEWKFAATGTKYIDGSIETYMWHN